MSAARQVAMASEKHQESGRAAKRPFLRWNRTQNDAEPRKSRPPTWSMGVLNDRDTVEVPGSVLLLAAHRNEPLGLRNVHARTSHSSIPTGFPVDVPMTPGGTRPMPHSPGVPASRTSHDHVMSTPVPPRNAVHSPPRLPADVHEEEEKKRTEDGQIILDPQPDDSANDPLNWPNWRRDAALLSLGVYCMIGGGITPLIAAGFTDVAQEYDVDTEHVALTTGFCMMGLGLGSVLFSPTAILWGKRPVYLFSAVLFIVTSLWAGFSPTFGSLLAARVFQGVAVSPVECLPSATIAEIFFLHERAYRIGIYTLLLLGGKNLVPLVSAAVIGRFGWRWTFWIVAMIVGLCGVLLFLFVPETFWDRTPTRKPHKRPSFLRRLSSRHGGHTPRTPGPVRHVEDDAERPVSQGAAARGKDRHVGFAPDVVEEESFTEKDSMRKRSLEDVQVPKFPDPVHDKSQPIDFAASSTEPVVSSGDRVTSSREHDMTAAGEPIIAGRPVPTIGDPAAAPLETRQDDSQATPSSIPVARYEPSMDGQCVGSPFTPDNGSASNVDYFMGAHNLDNERFPASELRAPPKFKAYTHNLRQQPAQSFVQQLRPFHGRLNNDKWLKVMVRPFILYAYPSVLWSAIVYACSVGWLIVIAETMAVIYRDPSIYGFTALQTGLVYVSPFVGGILGTGVAGKISDIIVRAMSRRNGGLYEPEFRLVMAAPILVTTCIGLMGFGWSAEQKNHWIVPTIFFGVVSFGCSLGSTTSITFCVDSYRQYAGEALVTLNFTKNICHGLVFSLFVAQWMAEDGPKTVYIWIGIIQLILMLFTIPMYIYGKRARMWTVRKNLMEKF